ncbi:MAG: MBL fold metallo-hydrolase, partial [Deltaproteobacteria bacterium]|nr:MBL fold metallo-hydrolase [Deltaproteobacteria bacterium]
RPRREHQGLEGEEIARLRRTLPHDEVFERVRTPLVAYVPDTLPEALDAMPEGCWAAQVLLVECTFLDDRKPLEKIRQGAHVHLDDLVARLDRFHGGAIVPFHFSRSYEAGEIPALLEARVPAPWRERVVPFI